MHIRPPLPLHVGCVYFLPVARMWKCGVFLGGQPQTSNETAALAQSRDSADFHAYMNRTQVAPNVRTNNASIDAFNSVIGPLQTVLMPIMKKNGWPVRNPVSPQFMWETNGQVYVQGGYTKDQTALILKVVRTGKAAK
jgi:hypothetical protein